MTAPGVPGAAWAGWSQIGGQVPAVRQIAKSEKAAREFEALLLAPVLESLRKSFVGAGESEMPGAGDYRSMATHALAEALAERGGIGIARLVRSDLDRAHRDPTHPDTPKVRGGG